MHPTPFCGKCGCRHGSEFDCGMDADEGPHNKAREMERKERQARWAGMNRHERRAAQAMERRSRRP